MAVVWNQRGLAAMWGRSPPGDATTAFYGKGRAWRGAGFGTGRLDCGEAPPAVTVEPPTVVVAAPVQKTVTDHADYTGRTEAVESVDVRARVTGYLVKINFEPGKEVKKDAVLFVIDERPYRATLEQD